MKLTIEQLSTALPNDLQPLYILSSDEQLLIDETFEQIFQAAQTKEFSEIEKLYDQNQNCWEQFLNISKTRSLFATKAIIKFSLAKKLNTQDKTILQNYAAKPSKDKILVLIMPKLDAATLRSKWFKAIETQGALLRLWPPDLKELPGWTLRRLQNNGINCNLQIANLIATKNANNLLAIKQEIEKLKLLLGSNSNPEDSLELIVNNLSNNAKFSVFDLSDYALAGKRAKVIEILQCLKNEGAEPIVILWTLIRDIKTILRIQNQLKQRNSIDSILEKEKVFYKRKNLMAQAIRRLSTSRLQSLIQKAARIDRSIKGVEKNDVWLELLSLTLKLT